MSPTSLHGMCQTCWGDGGALLPVVSCVCLLETKPIHFGPRVTAEFKPAHTSHLAIIKIYA